MVGARAVGTREVGTRRLCNRGLQLCHTKPAAEAVRGPACSCVLCSAAANSNPCVVQPGLYCVKLRYRIAQRDADRNTVPGPSEIRLHCGRRFRGEVTRNGSIMSRRTAKRPAADLGQRPGSRLGREVFVTLRCNCTFRPVKVQRHAAAIRTTDRPGKDAKLRVEALGSGPGHPEEGSGFVQPQWVLSFGLAPWYCCPCIAAGGWRA